MIATVMCTSPAMAHNGTGLAGGFVSGFRHPFTGMDHLLAMVAVGVWGAFLGRPLIYLLPIIFPLMMVGGAMLGMTGVSLPPVEIGIALSVMGLGGCIALAWRAPVWMAVAVIAIFALFHGYAHGMELPSAADPIGYSSGFVLATGLLHVAGVGVGLFTARPGGLIATRVLGGGIGLTGIWFLTMAVGR
ncbi:MAG: HupE/UreJ family protein [Pseudomonadota bacterium]|uniref:HupE/UreJ family protein n=1 Tax=Sphingomonas sp. ERG5 TaxID=1381597 RepID=UPI00054BF26F|nr:HupE/UreJ family protein [Sphingomonas sp. ERG5]